MSFINYVKNVLMIICKFCMKTQRTTPPISTVRTDLFASEDEQIFEMKLFIVNIYCSVEFFKC